MPLLGKHMGDLYVNGLPVVKYKNAYLFELRTWLRRAGKKFRWISTNMPAVSINQGILNLARLWNRLIVVVDAKTKEVYVIESETVLQYCKDWKILTKERELLVCPKSFLYRYKCESIEEVREKCRHLRTTLTLLP